VAVAAEDAVVAEAGLLDLVVARAAEEPVVAIAAVDRVVAPGTVDGVVAVAADGAVVALQAEERVFAAEAVERVGGARAADAIGAGAAEADDRAGAGREEERPGEREGERGQQADTHDAQHVSSGAALPGACAGSPLSRAARTAGGARGRSAPSGGCRTPACRTTPRSGCATGR